MLLWQCHMSNHHGPEHRPDPAGDPGASTAERLVEAAVDVIERLGDSGIRVRDVAEVAGVTYSAVQFHFGGRDGLIDAAYLELYRRDLLGPVADAATAFAAASSASGFTDALRSIVAALLVPERIDNRRRRAQAIGAAVTRPSLASALTELHNEYFDRLAELLEGPRSRGWMRDDLDVRAVGAVYIGIVNARALVEFPGSAVDPDAWTEAAMTAVLALSRPVADPTP